MSWASYGLVHGNAVEARSCGEAVPYAAASRSAVVGGVRVFASAHKLAASDERLAASTAATIDETRIPSFATQSMRQARRNQ